MKHTLKRLPLAVAVLGALSVQAAMAQDEPKVTLDTLNVTVDRQGTKVKTNVVTLQEKDESTATDLRGLLQSEPAIDFSGGTGTAQYLTVRGIGQNSVDVKVDNGYSDSQILYHQGRHMLDPALVKIVSVQKGAGSASAGIGATNGAIVAKTLDARDLLKDSDKDWGIKVNAGYSSNDEHSYGVTGFGKAGNFDFLVSANKVDQDNYRPGRKVGRKDSTTEAGKYFSPYTGDKCVTQYGHEFCQDPKHPSDKVAFQALERQSYLVKAGYNFDDESRIALTHFNTANNGVRNVREEFEWLFRPPVSDKSAVNYGGYRKLKMENTNLEYTGNAGILGKAEANAYLMKNSSEYADARFSGYAGNTNGKTSVETTGLNLGFDKQLNDDTLFKYGANYRHQETTPHMKNKDGKIQTTEKDDIGVYGEVIADIGKLTLTGGMRYDHFDYTSVTGRKVSDGAFSPSIGLIYQATPSLSFNAVHNHASRSPRLVDVLLAAGGRAADIAPGTKAEQAKNTEVGFNYHNGNLSVDGTYFWQEIDNLLEKGQVARHGDSSDTFNGISNVGYGKNRGYEINTRYRVNGFTARLGVAQSNPEYHSVKDAQGKDIRFDNREFGSTLGRTWTAGLAYRFTNPNLEVGVNHRRVDDVKGQSAYMTHIAGNRGNDLNMIKYGYDVTDVYANWKPLNNDKLNVNLAVNNVGDEFYYSHSAINGLPGAGREYRVGVNFTY
ncbi:TonB-dependent receptor domain-containing protein [Moraxella ovis]|uniref:TonB-dependent receptor domain-containing protein n=1 Tax=Moraxella ovis TaxID=29433 RepID=UPI000D8B41E8|nr:TonB-dependent receptor [Moraxella ovis]SPX86867.1 Heme/hemopexin utilization protein C precursor [Moraxella ovis]STZ05568.1 Heme/hemopexin utilization protein C precursor [Moraxella ovis]